VGQAAEPVEQRALLPWVARLLVFVAVVQIFQARAHAVATKRAQLLHGVEALPRQRFVLLVFVEAVAKLVALQVLIEQVWLLHDGVADGDVGVGHWHAEDVAIDAPEVNRLLECIHKLVHVFANERRLHFLGEVLAALRDEQIATEEVLELRLRVLRPVQLSDFIVIEVHQGVLLFIIVPDTHLAVDCAEHVVAVGKLLLRALGLLLHVLRNDSHKLMELARTVHLFHVVCNSCIFLDLRVVREVLQVHVADRVPANSVEKSLLVFFVAFPINHHFVDCDRLVIVAARSHAFVGEARLGVNVQELGASLDALIDPRLIELVPAHVEELLGYFLVLKAILLDDFFQDLLELLLGEVLHACLIANLFHILLQDGLLLCLLSGGKLVDLLKVKLGVLIFEKLVFFE